MNQTEREVIEGLFGKLRTVESQAPVREPDAERFINERVAAQPAAPYYMAQTIVVQEHALKASNERIAELERELASRPAGGGGFLAGLFGGGQPARTTPAHRPSHGAAPYHDAPKGGFLAGAMQTAVGVGGGLLLGNAVMSMFGGDEAQAAEPEPEPEPEPEEDGGFFGGDEEEF